MPSESCLPPRAPGDPVLSGCNISVGAGGACSRGNGRRSKLGGMEVLTWLEMKKPGCKRAFSNGSHETSGAGEGQDPNRLPESSHHSACHALWDKGTHRGNKHQNSREELGQIPTLHGPQRMDWRCPEKDGQEE